MNEPQGTDAERAMDKMQDLQRENDRLVDEGMRQKADLRSVTEERDLLQDELDTRARAVSNDSQIKFLMGLLEAEREQTNTKSTQLAQAVKLAADQSKEIDNIKCNSGRLQRMCDEARLQAQEYQNAFLIQAEQVDAAKDEAAALTYKLAEANVLLLTRERRLSAPEVRRANDRLAAENRHLKKDLDERDTRLGVLSKRTIDYHEALSQLMDEVAELELANGHLEDVMAEMRADQAEAKSAALRAHDNEDPEF